MPITIIKAVVSPNSPILLAAARMEARVRDAFLAAVAVVKDQIVVSKLEEALRAGDAARALALIAIEERFANALRGAGLEAGLRSFADGVRSAYQAGAEAAMKTLPARVGVTMSFDLLNQESVRFLQSYTFDLIQQVTQETRAAVQQVVLRAFKESGHPYEQARTIKNIVGLTARMEQAVDNYRKALEAGGSALRDALNRSLRDGRYDATLLRALRENQALPKAKIDAIVDRYRQRYLQYRARNIARTETLRASAKGQRELWRQAVQQGLLPHEAKRRWRTADDDRVCPICEALDGEERGLNEPFTGGIMDPPDVHPSCRCSVSLVSGSLRRAA